MKLPNLPTDNLYKFLAIFGLVLFVFSVYMMNDIKTESKLIYKNTEIKVLELRKNILSVPKNEKLIKQVAILETEAYKSAMNLNKKVYGFYLICFISTVLIYIGFRQWYHKTQKFNDIKLKKEALNDVKEISIHKMQFEKEFTIYNELWKKLIELKNKMGTAEHFFNFMNDPEKNEYDINEILKNCVSFIQENEPFYPKDVHEELVNFIELSTSFNTFFNESEFRSDNFGEKIKDYKESMSTAIDSICEKIRERIGLIRVKS